MPSGYRLTQKEVEKRIRDLHGDEIDLSKFIFVTQRTKSIFICNVNPEHGEWLAHPKELYRTDGKKTGCPKCAKDKFKPMTPWEEVSEKLKQIHGDEYEYYSENYNGVAKNIDVRCKHHNHIWNVRVMDLLKGQGCPKCGYEKSSEKRVIKVSEFIERSIKKHGDRYDYSKVHQFKRQKEKVTIICTKHGEFQQTPHDHQLGAGCTKCWEEIRSEVLTLPWEEVLKSFRETHDDTYDYVENTYVNSHETMEIICKKHGVFEQSVANHRIGYGCPKCGRERISEFLTTPWEEVLKSFREIHKDEYRYTPESYTLLETPMEMFCSKHGRFEQTPKSHRKGSGCPECGRERISELRTLSWEEVLTSFREVHRDEYEYNEHTYTKTQEKMEMICKKHGVFLQTPMTHKQGKGCPVCNSSTGEKEITHLLNDLGIEFEHQKTYKELGRKRFDFYIPSINTIIEYNGIQHYEIKDFFGGERGFKTLVKNDKIKKQYCLDNGINYEVIKYDEDTKLRILEILEKYRG